MTNIEAEFLLKSMIARARESIPSNHPNTTTKTELRTNDMIQFLDPPGSDKQHIASWAIAMKQLYTAGATREPRTRILGRTKKLRSQPPRGKDASVS